MADSGTTPAHNGASPEPTSAMSVGDVSMNGDRSKKRSRGKRAGKHHKKKLQLAVSPVPGDGNPPVVAAPVPLGPPQPVRLTTQASTTSTVDTGTGKSNDADLSGDGSSDGGGNATTGDADTRGGGAVKKKRRRVRHRHRETLNYSEMTIAQKLRFEAAEARRFAKQQRAEARVVPTDKRGRIKKGVDLQDYRPNAPRHLLPLNSGDLTVDVNSSSEDEEEDLSELIGAATAVSLPDILPPIPTATATLTNTTVTTTTTTTAAEGVSVTRSGSTPIVSGDVHTSVGDNVIDHPYFMNPVPLERRESIDSMAGYTGDEGGLDTDLELDMTTEFDRPLDFFQSNATGDDGLLGVEVGQSTEQLLATITKLKGEKRDLHDRLRASEFEMVHLRRKLDAATRKLQAIAQRNQHKRQAQGHAQAQGHTQAQPQTQQHRHARTQHRHQQRQQGPPQAQQAQQQQQSQLQPQQHAAEPPA